jgi:hypothetical protein
MDAQERTEKVSMDSGHIWSILIDILDAHVAIVLTVNRRCTQQHFDNQGAPVFMKAPERRSRLGGGSIMKAALP